MAQLFPPDFDFSTVPESERRTVESFMLGLDDSWYVVPHVPIVVDHGDSEIDIILLSQDHGMFVVEVKGGAITVDQGQWKQNGHKLPKSPFLQATAAKHELVRRLRSMKIDLDGVFIKHVVAFPDNVDFPDSGGGPDAPRSLIFTKYELSWPSQSLAALSESDFTISNNSVVSILRALKPTVESIEVEGGYITGATQRISQASFNELKLLFGLDENHRIILRGGAGTGKTFLGTTWAKRALLRGERTLMLCYNKALGLDLHEHLSDFAEKTATTKLLRVGHFHGVAIEILGEKTPPVLDPKDQIFWANAHADALIRHRDVLHERFDTIIIDEGQDIPEKWLTALEGLLSDSSSNRLFIALDEEQDIFNERPGLPRNATVFRLQNNVRSTQKVALFGARLGGANVPVSAPIGPEVDVFRVGGKRERSKKIGQVLNKIVHEMNIPPSQILILVPHNSDLDELTAEPINGFTINHLVDRDEESIACATIHGTKGLERLAVIVASMDGDVKENVIYVALTRASVYLAIIGTEKFLESAKALHIEISDPQSASELTANPSNDEGDIERVSLEP
jgi:hypothetical protein